LTLTIESTIEVVGTLHPVPQGKTAPGGHELSVDYWRVIGAAPGAEDAFTNRLNEVHTFPLSLPQIHAYHHQKSDPSIQADLRHLVLRGEHASGVLRLRSHLLNAFREAYASENILEVNTPCLVQTQVEGGATLFKLDYYGQSAFLTQSSQLYLETCLPSLGDVFCVQESFRAENRQVVTVICLVYNVLKVKNSHTRRHLSEYTHMEAELAFIDFNDLMSHIEEIVRTCQPLDPDYQFTPSHRFAKP
jgi:asparaginyl-tRNA synthetase